MYLSSNDGINDVDVDDNSQAEQGNSPPVTSAPSQSLSPSCPTLLVIDDNSNSNDSSLNTNDIPSNSMLSNAQPSSNQTTRSSPIPTIDVTNDTPEQQRRRNSSIAKLLGGQPLNNHQYEEIHQQILDDQSAQNGTNNNDNGTDTGIQRSRSSITRTLLLNAERNNNSTSTNIAKGPPSPEFSKNFEYLIRRELDIEHAPLTLHSSSAPSIFQNLSSVRNTPPPNAQSPLQSKFKRKRPNPKPTISTSPSTKSLNSSPFVIRDPFELDSSAPTLVPPLNPTHIQRSHHHQNDLFRFDPSHRHHRPPPPPPPHHHHHQQQQQYSLPMNSPTVNSSVYPGHKLNLNSPVYTQFKLQHDRLPSTPPSSSSSSSSSLSSYNCCRYPPTVELALPMPVSPLSPHTSSPSIIPPHTIGGSSRKTKMHRPDMYEIPNPRPYSSMSNQSNVSSIPSPSSSGHSIPLKKRLLHAYNNEQRPSSTL
jgi:hypothetical protein